MRALGLILNTSNQRAATIGYGTNAEALKIKHGNNRGDRSPLARSLAAHLQHPRSDHSPHERLNVFLDDFKIGILRQKPLLDGQQALQHSVIAQQGRIGTSSYDGVHFQAEQLHGAGAFTKVTKKSDFSR